LPPGAKNDSILDGQGRSLPLQFSNDPEDQQYLSTLSVSGPFTSFASLPRPSSHHHSSPFNPPDQPHLNARQHQPSDPHPTATSPLPVWQKQAGSQHPSQAPITCSVVQCQQPNQMHCANQVEEPTIPRDPEKAWDRLLLRCRLRQSRA
jgi:hypothetical protein